MTAIDEVAEYVDTNPAETKETYEQRRAELKEVADPIVEHVSICLLQSQESCAVASCHANCNGLLPDWAILRWPYMAVSALHDLIPRARLCIK